MLAMDVPIAGMAGFVLAEAGKGLIESGEKYKLGFIRAFVFAFSACVTAPNAIYYFVGWPAWELNYLGPWTDHTFNNPPVAAWLFIILALSVLPAWGTFELGRHFIKIGKPKWIRIGYIGMLLIVGVVILVLNDITNWVYLTYVDYVAVMAGKPGNYFFIWTNVPWITGWAITTTYFWATLFGSYAILRKKS